MIFADFFKALRQIGDPRFRRVMFFGILLALALLGGCYALLLWLLELYNPGSVDIPYIGPVGGLDTLLSWGSFLLMIGLSIALMIPVASAFSGLFLEDVARAVEARFYPNLPPARPARLSETLIDTVNFIGLMIAANVVALVAYGFAGPFIPVIFWGLNGLLLGREYFSLVALRRISRPEMKRLRRRHALQIWFAGTLMTAPLSMPFLNLVIPVLGAATFTHLYQRLAPPLAYSPSDIPRVNG